MFDDPLRKLIAPPFVASAELVARWPVSASSVTATGFTAGLMAIGCIALHRPVSGLGFVILYRLLDGIAAPLARARQDSELAGYLAIVFDCLIRAGIPLAFALADPSRALAAAFVIFGLMGTGTAALALKMLVAPRGIAADGPGARAFHPPGELTETATIYVALSVACLMSAWFSVIAYVLGVLCFATMGLRVAAAIESSK